MSKSAAVLLLLLNLVMLLPAALLALMAGFMFDAPGASNNVLLWALALGAMLAPYAFLAGAAFAISALIKPSRTALRLSAALLVAPIVYVGSSYTLFAAICDGSTVCA